MGFSIFNPIARNSGYVKILRLVLYRLGSLPIGAPSHRVYAKDDYF